MEVVVAMELCKEIVIFNQPGFITNGFVLQWNLVMQIEIFKSTRVHHKWGSVAIEACMQIVIFNRN
jgi:hypothetical protein